MWTTFVIHWNMWYRIDINKLAEQLLPPILRTPLLLAILRVLLSPIATVLTLFSTYRQNVNDALCINSHVLPLEAAMNKACQTDAIYIESVNYPKDIYIYHESEHQPATYIYKEAEENTPCHLYPEHQPQPDVNFRVHVPPDRCTDLTSRDADDYGWLYLDRIRAILDRYKPAGTAYEIVIADPQSEL